MTEPSHETEQLTARIIECYLSIRREEQPEYSIRPNPKTLAIFHKAAALCESMGLSAEEFVQQQYENRPNENEVFYPSMLLNKYTKFNNMSSGMSTAADISPEQLLKVQEGYLRDQLTRRKRTVEEALLDDMIGFQPWFRVLITDRPIPSVVAKYKDKVRASLTPALVAFLTHNKFDLSRYQA